MVEAQAKTVSTTYATSEFMRKILTLLIAAEGAWYSYLFFEPILVRFVLKLDLGAKHRIEMAAKRTTTYSGDWFYDALGDCAVCAGVMAVACLVVFIAITESCNMIRWRGKQQPSFC